ncbi:ROK family protein [Fusobacterium perfoetens]|uniref:ROK family protein n=1 Tax=Fusobacterium perfoetens TaxID=852 RepID=UPI000686837D|nr:ROK family protein [Fusobacterium perfoetens]MCI6153226.1 ROK family protein [Fusobacterium perfoetens]MDY3238327.1 ROK family protein [Fusobacterium perfoetens]
MKENIREEEILKIIKESGEISRLELSEKFDLTLARISKVVKKLLEKKMVIEKTVGESTGGRPPVYLSINNENFKNILGINFTSNQYLYITHGTISGEIIRKRKIIFDSQESEDALEFIDKIIKKEMKTSRNIGVISIVMTGVIDEEKGLSVMAPHYKLKTPKIVEYFEREYNIPVLLENDVRAMALVEKQIGSCKNTENFVILNICEGIGSTSCIERKVYRGYNSMAGEIGHIVINPSSIRKCSCGKRGCLEAESSEKAIIKKITSEIKIGKYSILKDILKERELNIRDILFGIKKKDFLVIQVMTEAMEHIARGLNILISMLDPEKIILVGEMFSSKFLMDTLKFELNKISLDIQKCGIEPTKLGEDLYFYCPIAVVVENIFENKIFTEKFIKN